MEFDELLDRVVALVNERGRVSLAAVGEYFKLGESRLTAVRDELVDARAAVDLEDGRILVARSTLPLTDAERRHLTVMFVDLVGSTDLAARLDPEDLRELVRRYQQTVAHAIERFHGYIAQYLGDGVLVYFGYPHAHDDDARRAVYAAHDVLGRLDELNTTLETDFAVAVALRIGIHTGLVVVGEVGAGQRHEALALGEVPNVAARLESVAPTNAIALSEQTRALLGEQFELQSLGPTALKGLPEPVPVYRSVRPSGVASAFDQAVKHKLLPLAGRRDELAQLKAAWAGACEGHGGTVLVTGDPGIGKSRLIQALKDDLIERDQRWTALRASAYHRKTPLYPVVALLRQTIGIDERDSDAINFMRIKAALDDLDAASVEAAGLIAALCDVGLPDELAERVEVSRAAGVFAELFMAFLLREPRLLVVEDVHWLDPSSLALIAKMMQRAPAENLLVVASARPGFDLAAHTQSQVVVDHLRLGPLPAADVASMIRSVAGERRLSDEVVSAIAERTDGVPAFVEELSRMLLTSDWVVQRDGVLVPDGPLPKTIPVTLTDTLLARLDRLGDAKAVAQEAAVLGRTFSAAHLAAISQFEPVRLDGALQALADAQVIRRVSRIGADSWRFRHALLQEAAYESLLKARRQTLHLALADALEARFQSFAAQQPERVAQHFELGGEPVRALGYWQWAAEQAVERGAVVEALSHVAAAMGVLDGLPEDALRDQRELSLLSIKGSALVLRHGWAAESLGPLYERALALVARSGSGAHVDFQVLGGLCAYHLLRGEMETVKLLSERLEQQGRAIDDTKALTVAHLCRCIGAFFGGRFAEARDEADLVARYYDPGTRVPVSFLYGQDPIVIARSTLAMLIYLEGDRHAALSLSAEVARTAQALPGRFSGVWANAWHARLLYESGEYAQSLELSAQTAALCEELGFGYVRALVEMVQGLSEIALGQQAAGLQHVHEALRLHRASPSAIAHNHFFALAVKAMALSGDLRGAREAAERALAMPRDTVDVPWRSELLRWHAALLHGRDPHAAGALFGEALASANSIGAVRLALRAATHWLSVEPANEPARAAAEQAIAAINDADGDRDVRRARAQLA